MIRNFLFTLTFAIATAASANANTILFVLLDPPTTAGAGATSTRSGNGTFHLYAADDNVGSYGIATYSITLGPAVTGSNNRAPSTTISDINGDPQSAGFTLLRSASNANPMTGGQNLPGQTPFLIKGIGQTTGTFTAVAATQAGASVVGPTVSGSWGGPYPAITSQYQTGYNGKSWAFLGEGAYNSALVTAPFWQNVSSIVSAATFTTYGNDAPGVFTQIARETSIITLIPEPASLSLVAVALAGTLGIRRRTS